MSEEWIQAAVKLIEALQADNSLQGACDGVRLHHKQIKVFVELC